MSCKNPEPVDRRHRRDERKRNNQLDERQQLTAQWRWTLAGDGRWTATARRRGQQWTAQLRAHHEIGQIHGGDGTKCQSPPRWIVPKPSANGIANCVRMTPACSVGASSCTRWWYGPKPLTTMVASDTKLVLRQGWILWAKKYRRSMVHFYVRLKQLQQLSQDSN